MWSSRLKTKRLIDFKTAWLIEKGFSGNIWRKLLPGTQYLRFTQLFSVGCTFGLIIAPTLCSACFPNSKSWNSDLNELGNKGSSGWLEQAMPYLIIVIRVSLMSFATRETVRRSKKDGEWLRVIRDWWCWEKRRWGLLGRCCCKKAAVQYHGLYLYSVGTQDL